MDHIPYRPERLTPEESLARSEALLQRMDARRSVRFFAPEPVPRVLIEGAILAASTAPSGAHRQPWTFVAVSRPDAKRRIREAAEAEEKAFYEERAPEAWLEALRPIGTSWEKPYLETVPWLVVLFAQRWGVAPDGEKVKNYYVSESCGIAAGMFVSALHEMGLSTLTHTPSPMGFLSELLERPKNEQAMIRFPVGYPAPDATVPDLRRKGFDEVAVFVE